MSLAAGDKLGPYEILSLLGKGGMGEVYRAHDPRTGRDVAIKVSAERFNERFDREVRAVAALNHPNICTLYDVGPNFLVMELVEGEAPEGPMPLDAALRIARQIADALEAAHEKGITHRDLKPANIKVKPDGTVKVLDFGLAKLGGTPTAPSQDSPTLSIAATQAGVILGTAAYMSPEQARGKQVDRRADIWAFGVVLYELLTGERLFQGEDMTDTLARVVRDQSDLSPVPPKVRRLLERCLEKDPKNRLRDIGDVWMLLEEPSSITAPSRSRIGWFAWTAAAMFLLSTAAFAFLWLRNPVPETLAAQFVIDPPAGTQFTSQYGATAISPDGRYVVFGAGKQGSAPLWLRPLDALVAQPLQGTENANMPFWSPDSKSIAYYQGGKLKRSDIVGGGPQVLCDAVPLVSAGGTWSRDGTILFASTGGLFRVASSGGVPQKVTELDTGRNEGEHGYPQFLPDGNRFLYLILGDASVQGIYEGSLDNPKQRVRIVATDRKASYVPPHQGHSGYLLWMRENTLLAQPFDAAKLSLEGSAAPVAEEVASTPASLRTAYWTSESGVLTYRTATSSGASTLTWFDRQGKAISTVGNPQGYGELALSPDGTQVAVFRRDSIGDDLWIIELARGSSTRLTTDPGNESYPVWSPDGKQVAFGSERAAKSAFDLYKKPAGASGEEVLLLNDDAKKFPTDWSRDGRFLLYSSYPNGEKNSDLWVLPMDGDRKPAKYLATEFNELGGRFSPDGRWVAYASDVSKRFEIYVSPFPDAAASPAVLVSTDSGMLPRWRRDGKGLYYLGADRKLMEVDVTPGPPFKAGVPKVLFQTPVLGANDPNGSSWDVSPDGQRFLVNTAAEVQNAAPLTILTNWQARLKK